jgi:hypothetical protein
MGAQIVLLMDADLGTALTIALDGYGPVMKGDIMMSEESIR